MASFLNVYNRSLQKTAVLQNASSITETRQINQIYHLTFDLPASDPKAEYLQPFHYVRYGEDGELYRIVKLTYAESEIGALHTECEHVIATLIDTIMFGNVTIGESNLHTAAVIRNLLNRQKVKNWELGTCDLDGQFEYGFEQENLLNAIYSVPKCFVDAYYWDFDTSGTKWKLHLRKINPSINPEFYIRAKSNLLAQGNTQENSEICTRIYPLGYGEGVNQLTIKDANNGVAYLENTTAVAQYGVIEKVLVDRRFENASSLKAYAQSVLDKLSVPGYSRTFDVVDLYPITGMEIDNAQVGKICKMTGDGSIAYITKTVRVLDDPGNLKIELSTQATDVVSTIADLADRVRIESVYSQGATQLYQHSKDANAAPQKGKGMVLSLYFPSEMKQINKVLLKLELKKFRSYSDTTSNGGGTTATSSSGGATSTTTSSGGGTSTTTSSGGGTSTTTSSGGGTGSTSTSDADIAGSGSSDPVWTWSDFDYAYTGTAVATQNNIYTEDADGSEGEHNHQITEINIPSLAMDKEQFSHSHNVSVSCGSHSHTFSVPNHSHSFSVPNHSHSFSVPNHSHSFSIPAHSHSVTIPDHTHSIVPGIFENRENPTKFDIYVGSNQTPKATVNAKSYNSDITTWLLNDQNMIPRNTWINIEIVPDTLAYVVSSVFVQGFVQSRGGGNY